jgi:uroporphyrinogen decarboxylase
VRYRYPGVPGEKPRLEEWPVHEGADWAKITSRPHNAGALGEQIEAVRMMRAMLPPEVPLIETVFTPLAVLGEMTETPGELKLHMSTHPELVRSALEAVTATYERYVRELIGAGADGLFFATVDWASRNLMSADEYRAWARPWDLRVLAAVPEAPFHVLHVCGSRNLLFELADYPVAAFSWAATDPTNPTLAAALERVPGAVMGGISQADALLQRAPDAALAEYRLALEETGGRRWLVAPGCSIPPDVPQHNLRAIRDAVGSTRLAAAPP